MKYHDFVMVNTEFYINEKAWVLDMEYRYQQSEQADRQGKKYLVQFYNFNYQKWINEEQLTQVER